MGIELEGSMRWEQLADHEQEEKATKVKASDNNFWNEFASLIANQGKMPSQINNISSKRFFKSPANVKLRITNGFWKDAILDICFTESGLKVVLYCKHKNQIDRSNRYCKYWEYILNKWGIIAYMRAEVACT